MLTNLACVAAGGMLGSLLRYLVARVTPLTGFPLATLAVNVIGCFVTGLLYALLMQRAADNALRLFLLTGVLGGFTTFSAFSLETINLLQDGYPGRALLNVAASVALCLLACLAGMSALRWP